MLSVASELAWVFDRIALLHMGGTSTILKIVDVLVAHKGVLNAAKINPDVGQLMREERAGI